MKIIKQLVALLLVLLVTFTAVAQTTARAYYFEVGKWNTSRQAYDWSSRECDLVIEFTKKAVRINNTAGSTYITGRVTEDIDNREKRVTEWDAVDEEGLRCTLTVLHVKKDNVKLLIAVYSDIALRWYLE